MEDTPPGIRPGLQMVEPRASLKKMRATYNRICCKREVSRTDAFL